MRLRRTVLHASPGLLIAALWTLPLKAADPAAEPRCDPKKNPCPASDTSAGSQRAEIVVTGTRTKEASQRATVRTEFVTRAEADRRGARNVAEALSGESTLSLQSATSGVAGGIRINGMDGERVLVLEDGEPISGRSSGAVDLAELPLVGVERVEYVAGPMSALYGSDAIGGVINLITGPPIHEGPSLSTRSEVRSRGGSFDELSANYKRGTSWATLESSLASQNAFEDGGGPTLLLPSTRSGTLGLRAGARVLPRVELSLKARWTRDLRESIFANEEVIGGDPLIRLEAPTLTSNRYSFRALETVHLGPRSRFDFSIGRSWYGADTRTFRPRRPDDNLQQDREKTQSFEGILTVGEDTRTWVFGVTSRSEKLTSEAQTTTTDVFPPVFEKRDALPPTLRASAAALGQLGWELTPKLTVMPGFRLELHNQHGAVPTPRLAVAYRANDAVTLRVAGGRGFRSPSPKELGYQLDHCWLGYSVTGDPGLNPEKSWGLTADATVRKTDRVVIRLGSFANWVNDLIDLSIRDEGLCALGTNYVAVNLERARTAGADLSVKVRPFEWLSSGLSYAYLWTRDEATGQQVSNNPPHTFVAWVTADKLPLGLSGQLRFRRTSDAFVENGAQDLSSLGYDALNARVAVRPLAQLEAYVGADNLLNVTSRDDDGALISLISAQRPRVGTTFYVGLSGEFSAADDADTP